MWLLALVLAVPAGLLLLRAGLGPWTDDEFYALMHGSGELSVRLLIVALLATPLQRIRPRAAVVKWLRRRRRVFGVAAAGYAVLHAAVYLRHLAPDDVLGDLRQPGYVLGWVAVLAMLPLAATSFDRAVKRLGRRWKALHRAAYLAAVAAALHWWLKPEGATRLAVVLHFAPLLVLQIQRIRIGRARQPQSR